MSTLVKAWCDCGWHGEYTSEAKANYARRRHSCDVHRARRDRLRKRIEREKSRQWTERPCLCKEANHQHGTRAKYVIDKCRCKPCSSAAREAENERRRQRAYGIEPYVDATAATAHVRELMAAGMGWKRVARAARVPEATVYPLLYGRPDRNGGRPRTKASRKTVDRLLAVPFPTLDDYANKTLVPLAGSLRRIKALQSAGWSIDRIAERSGVDRQVMDGMLSGAHSQITAANARAIRDAYDAMWDVQPPAQTRWDRAAITRARKRAAARGWPMPMDLDDEYIDDPEAPEPTRSGEQTRTNADLDEWMHLVNAGENGDRAARRLGVTVAAIARSARRHGRPDIAQRAETARSQTRRAVA